MDPQRVREKLQAGRWRYEQGITLGPAPEGSSKGQRAFRRWLNDNKVTISAMVDATGISRATIGSLAGNGKNTSWEGLSEDRMARIVAAMNTLTPITVSEWKKQLGLFVEPEVDVTPWIRRVKVGGLCDLAVADVAWHVAIDPNDARKPHVFRGEKGTYLSMTMTQDRRLGRLISLMPS